MVFSYFRRKSWELSKGIHADEVAVSILQRIVSIIRDGWSFIFAICLPIVLLPIIICGEGNNGKEPFAAYVIALMALYWCTECVPLPVTAFIPVILFPMFGILSTGQVTPAYLSDSILFMFGGCILALSFEFTNLHQRIALKVIMLVGAKISQLMLGIMGTTMFLSMWMNNTSTTAMMVPIVEAIMEELKKKMMDALHEKQANDKQVVVSVGSQNDVLEESQVAETIATSRETEEKKINSRINDLKVMFLLATAYSSNIGGTGVITGSATNVIVLDLVRKDADEALATPECRKLMEISFLDWMVFNGPPMLINTLLTWLYLQFHFLGLECIPKSLKFWEKQTKESDEMEAMSKSFATSVEKSMAKQYKELGPTRFNEMAVLTLFCIMVFLWVFKDPQIIPGWDALPIFTRTASGKSMIKEATPTLLICIIMFAIPGKAEYYKKFLSPGGLQAGMNDPLLSFDYVLKKFPWGIFILLGGGSAMALGAKESGLNTQVKDFLEHNETLQSLPGPIILLIVLFFIATLTSVASNTATAAIVTPVLLGLSYVKNMHPLYMIYAASTACSYAFVLPVSTPPNAIVYSSTNLQLTDMMKPGLFVNVFCLGILFVTTHTTSWWIFNFGGYDGECSGMAMLGSPTT